MTVIQAQKSSDVIVLVFPAEGEITFDTACNQIMEEFGLTRMYYNWRSIVNDTYYKMTVDLNNQTESATFSLRGVMAMLSEAA